MRDNNEGLACDQRGWRQTEPGELVNDPTEGERYCFDVQLGMEPRNSEDAPERFEKEVGGGMWDKDGSLSYRQKRSVAALGNTTAAPDTPLNRTRGCRRAMPMTVFGYEAHDKVWSKLFTNITELELFERPTGPEVVSQLPKDDA